MRTVIVEDVDSIRKSMVERVKTQVPDLDFVGEAATVVEALKVIRQSKPDLLLLDIELPDGTAFDILDLVLDVPHVIFTTGAEEYALRAFRYAAADYLLKPISTEDLIDAVKRVKSQEQTAKDRMTVLREHLDNRRERISLHTQDRLIIVEISSIIRCEADGNYTRFIIDGEKPVLVAKTLKEYDKLLGDSGFVRVHQSHLVNLSKVKEFVKHDGGYLVMTDMSKVPVSTRKRSEVVERLSS